MLVRGPQHREIGTPISTDNASWGGAPTQRLAESQLTIMCKLAESQHNKSLVVLYLFCLTPLIAI
ncbi:hypothetical protein C7R17_12855 [Staphylococcus aureus]|nr:hypothetical protein C7R17_12855 [Staphylococcus aureus]